MSGVDPDVVENDIGVVWRTLYKLEKGFSEQPNALNMAQKVKGRVDDFKEHLTLIGALFNPGLRDRHWEKMSEIACQDLKPNEVQHHCMYHAGTCASTCTCIMYKLHVITMVMNIVMFSEYCVQTRTSASYFEMNLESYLEQFEGISEAASKEHSLEKALEKMISEWDAVRERERSSVEWNELICTSALSLSLTQMEFVLIVYRENGHQDSVLS